MMLKGKSVVITGAGRGIGREIALLMAKHGARVVVNDYGGTAAGSGGEKTPADEVVNEICKGGGEAVSNYESVATMAGGQAIIKSALDAFGRVDVVVNNAGILRDRMIFNMSEEEWDAVIDTHLKGTFAITRAATPHMREQRSGRIINMTSTSGLVGNIGQANYAAAKSGLFGLTNSLALETARKGITVNSVAPGFIATEMVAAMPEEILERVIKQIPVGRLGEPDEVARVVEFLADPESGYITGEIFDINGGLYM
jgi:NAD(P)-dependent dehydrogenase (short-subunit alcohol dehydrogenase family)